MENLLSLSFIGFNGMKSFLLFLSNPIPHHSVKVLFPDYVAAAFSVGGVVCADKKVF